MFFRIIILLIFASIINLAHAENANMAVASNFAIPFKKLANLFEVQTNHKVNIIIGSSGKLYAQINNGAPFDGFFSADADKPNRLMNDSLAVKNTSFTYAIGQLSLWKPNGTSASNPKTVAIANPKTAPYGKAAQQYLINNKPAQLNDAQIITAENVAQAYQFVKTGAAQAGFVALSQVLTEPMADYQIIPTSEYTPIKQNAVLLKHGQNNQAALDFFNFMQSQKAKDIVKNMGYNLPQ